MKLSNQYSAIGKASTSSRLVQQLARYSVYFTFFKLNAPIPISRVPPQGFPFPVLFELRGFRVLLEVSNGRPSTWIVWPQTDENEMAWPTGDASTSYSRGSAFLLKVHVRMAFASSTGNYW